YARYCTEMPEFYRTHSWIMHPHKRRDLWIFYAWYGANNNLGLWESLQWLLTRGPKKAWTSLVQRMRLEKYNLQTTGLLEKASLKENIAPSSAMFSSEEKSGVSQAAR
ncbi:MAG TPA: hypothetical protein VMG59_07105, partial [Phycisphaerae bacterium]|nr:hypothetical protein [Phycisphaerae bacterium]